MKCLCLNARSLGNKQEHLHNTLLSLNIDVCLVNETWLHSERLNTFKLDSYNVYRKDRDSLGGGVLIAVRNSLVSNELIIDNNVSESVFVEVYSKGATLLFCSLYLPPKEPISTLTGLANTVALIPITKYKSFIIGGDLNIHLDWNNFTTFDKHGDYLMNQFLSMGFSQFQLDPSYPFSKVNRNPLKNFDLLLARSSYEIKTTLIDNIHDNCDHKAILFNISTTIERSLPQYKLIPDYNNIDEISIKSDISLVDWKTVFEPLSADDAFEYFYDTFQRTFSKNIPQKKVRVDTKIAKF